MEIFMILKELEIYDLAKAVKDLTILAKLVKYIEQLVEDDQNEVETLINKIKQDYSQFDISTKIKVMIVIIFYYFDEENDEMVEFYLHELDELSKHNEYLIIFLKVATYMATRYVHFQELTLAKKYYLQVKERYEINKPDTNLAHIYNDLSVVNRGLGHFAEALEYSMKAIDLIKRFEVPILEYSYNNLASVYYQLSSYDKAFQYFTLALQIALANHNSRLISQLYNNIANVYNDLTDYEKAKSYYEKALELEIEKQDEAAQATVLFNLGIVNAQLNESDKAKQFFESSIALCKKYSLNKTHAQVLAELSEMYGTENKHKSALKALQEAKKLFEKVEDTFGLANALVQEGKVYYQLNDFQKGLEILKQAKDLCAEFQYDNTQKLCLEYLIKCCEKLGDVKQAFEWQSKMVKLRDESAEKEYQKRLAEMQILYEVESKEKEAEMYRSKTVELEQKNKTIEQQKLKLEKTLEKLKKAEISFEYVNKQLKDNLGSIIIGESKEIKNLITLVQKVAQTSSTSVLITGETGTGKELVARAIHDFSNRKENNFCAVNVSAVPEQLFESEFFGYKKNAFTGAMKDKAGWFEIANKGTLFLDEIGTLNPPMQSKFLRVLENQSFAPIGSNKEIYTDLRIISATNDDLHSLMAKKHFRMDLYHRFAAFVIHIPPLRERTQDIPVLLDYFINKFAQPMGKKIQKIENQVVTSLLAYNFPGNVRELRNMVERALIICNSSTLRLCHFVIPEMHISEEVVIPLEENDKIMVLRALKMTGFHQANAAKLLDITPKSLERRMIKYNLKKLKS
jgi:transcriptional regulator with PAS, ATPase and Fis domain